MFKQHDGTNGLGSDNGEDDHINSTNRLSVDFSHISSFSSIPLLSSIYKVNELLLVNHISAYKIITCLVLFLGLT